MWNLWIKKVEKLQHKYLSISTPAWDFPHHLTSPRQENNLPPQRASIRKDEKEETVPGVSRLFCWEALQHNTSGGSPAQAAASSAGFSVEPVRSWQMVQRASSSASRQHLQTPPSTSPPGALAASPPGPTRAKVRELQPLASASMRKDLKLHDPERQRLMKHFTYCELWTVNCYETCGNGSNSYTWPWFSTVWNKLFIGLQSVSCNSHHIYTYMIINILLRSMHLHDCKIYKSH